MFHTSFQKKHFYILYKKNLARTFFVFLPKPPKMLFFKKKLVLDIEYPGLHAKFILDFLHINFFYTILIGSYRFENQNTISIVAIHG
jgi:hypothetical protein